MQDRQAKALHALRDTVSYGRDLAAACQLRARLAERDPVPYALNSLAETLLTAVPETTSP
jgi:hypothetical protein